MLPSLSVNRSWNARLLPSISKHILFKENLLANYLPLIFVQFSRTMDVNVKAVLNISQVVAKKMVENKTHGAIVNISSQASKVSHYYK